MLIMLPLLVFVSMLWGYYLTARAWFSVDSALAITQTNPSEAWMYLQSTTPPWVAALVLSLLAAAVFAMARCEPLGKAALAPNRAAWLLLLFVAADVFVLARTRRNMYTGLLINTRSALARYQRFAELGAARQAKLRGADLQHVPGVYALVIGESLTRSHMSAYGYARPTTPWLDSLTGNPRAVVFGKPYSCYAATVPSLSYALTAKNQYNRLELEESPSLLEVANAAGMDTVWLSNQNKYGANETPLTIVASTAKRQAWLTADDSTGDLQDAHLLPKLAEFSDLSDTLVVIHLAGNHVLYEIRYPREFAWFDEGGGGNSVGCYDNSVRYNDDVMRRIVEHMSSVPNFKALVYFSDHGDDVETGLHHDSNRLTPDMVKIPMYAVFSEAYMAERPEVVAALKAHRDAPFTNDLVYNLMLGIMGARLPGEGYEPRNDFTSPDYDATPSRFRTLHGKRKIEE